MKTRLFAGLISLSLLAACAGPVTSPSPDRTKLIVDTPKQPRPSTSEVFRRPSPLITDRPELGFNAATASAEMAEQWIADAELAPPEEASELLLRAAEVLLREGELDRADDIVHELVAPELETDQAVRLALIRARVFRGHAQFQEALQQLSDPLIEEGILEAPLARQLQFSQLRASLYSIEGDHLRAAQEWIYIDPLLAPGQQTYNRAQIWDSLMQIPDKQLASQMDTADNRDYLGWLELAALAKNYQGNLNQQIIQRDAWLRRWPNHPAQGALPGGLGKLDQLVVERPDKIALLLPVSGRLAPYGKAIRDGFLAAYYDALSQGATLPQVKQYDTESRDVNAVYQQALHEGNSMVIGPLQKEDLDALIDKQGATMPVPTLALNRVPGQRFPNGLFQFGLNPEDEAQQIASIAAAKGYKRAMIVTPEGSWGTKVAEAFSEAWQQQGGLVVASTNFDASANNYSKKIKDALLIDASIKRRNLLQQIIGERPQFEPYRRTDVDFIFLVARPNEGRAIKPLLAYHYAGDIPVYATSHIYRGTKSPDKDQDLNGVHFIDIPWILNEDSNLHRAIANELPQSSNYQRMYALGVDSFRLHLRLGQLQSADSSRLFGETGTLRLNNLRQIERKLSLAEMQNGVPITVPMSENVDAGE
ncbi:penicillin-binding protein activator [Spongiibacter taiwanensis]|uniref:penicillin-binding protein activator n=1 Tax=Spongiibacter taiwanensis TaxID=1748242 RepID=UPI002035E703|nr:penicillin-binding protein activator [Spongiibacter taiwanensis]USA44285.1 penicillin-binding protein activator [Spongiibacter taiwanensis]